MSIEKVNEYLLIFDQEVGGFDLLEAFQLAKDEHMEGWELKFHLGDIYFHFYDMFGEDWATMKYNNSVDGIMVAVVTPYCFVVSTD